MKKNLNSIHQLLEYAEKGCVFHGSPNRNIKSLKPRQSNDLDPTNSFNNDNAVYATPYPCVSVIFACMSFDMVRGSVRRKVKGWGVSASEYGKDITAKIPHIVKKFVVKNTGYVYVLDGKNFIPESDSGWQVKSNQLVKPLKVIKVKFRDFEKLGGKIIWKKSEYLFLSK